MKQPINATLIRNKLRNRESFVAFLLTSMTVIAFLAIFGIRYEVNDDAIISNIAAGAYGTETHRLVYVNILLGWFFKFFYALLPSLNWFVILQFAGGIACFSVLGGLLLKKAGILNGAILFCLFLLLAGTDFFVFFHYVKYASLFLVTGLTLLACNLGQVNKASLAGLALALVGSMLRFQQFFAIGAMAAALLLWKYIKLDKAGKTRAACMVAGLCTLAFLFAGIDTLSYRASPAWAHYRTFNAVRTEISDFRLQYAETPEDIDGLDYSVTDFEMLQTWNFYDTEVFPLERLQETESALPYNTLPDASMSALKSALQTLYLSRIHILFAFTLLAWLIFSKKKNWPAFLGLLVMMGLLIFYLSWRGRYLPRIEYALVFAGVVFSSCFIQPRKIHTPSSTCFITCLLALAMLPSLIMLRTDMQDYRTSRLPRALQIDDISARKEHLYLLDVNLVDAANGYDVWHARPAGYFSNLVFTGSWLMQSPFQNDVLEAYGVQNLYADSINNDTVFFADFYHRALTEDYLREHYNPSVQVVLVSEHGDYNIYSAVSS